MASDTTTQPEGNQAPKGSPQGDTTEQPSSIPYARFKEVLDKAKDYENRFKALEEQQTNAQREYETKQLEEQGNYKQLAERVQQEREQAVRSAYEYISDAYLTQLAAKHGIVDPDAVQLFVAEFEFTPDFKISNTEAIDKKFEEWKSSKPYLFKGDDKPVPRTDNNPYRKPAADDIKQFTNVDLIRRALDIQQQQQ